MGKLWGLDPLRLKVDWRESQGVLSPSANTGTARPLNTLVHFQLEMSLLVIVNVLQISLAYKDIVQHLQFPWSKCTLLPVPVGAHEESNKDCGDLLLYRLLDANAFYTVAQK